jgi:preprotein translocase subunit SecY
MKKFFTSLKNAYKIEELRNKILITLSFILVYRIGSFIPLPLVNVDVLQQAASSGKGGILDLINAFSGGAFGRASILALGIMPYISASIVVQLMGLAIPYLQKLDKDGESGRKTKTQITRWLTILITLFQAPAYIQTQIMNVPGAIDPSNVTKFWFIATILLMTGTVFAMWLGEKITDRGIGNGISILIMAGIMARMPGAFLQEWVDKVSGGNGGMIMMLIEIVLWLLIILASVYLVLAVRQVPVQYARRNASGSLEKNVLGARQFLPLKLNASGVMPIIFAQAIMFVPALVFKNFDATQTLATKFSDMSSIPYNALFAFLIIIFTYFYTAITVPTSKMADDLKRSNGFIPGVRPGVETADYLDKIMSLITLPGAVFLAGIAIFPAFVMLFDVQQSWALFFGGTSLLIMVGVAIDTMQQINAYLLNSHYDGLMDTNSSRRK